MNSGAETTGEVQFSSRKPKVSKNEKVVSRGESAGGGSTEVEGRGEREGVEEVDEGEEEKEQEERDDDDDEDENGSFEWMRSMLRVITPELPGTGGSG